MKDIETMIFKLIKGIEQYLMYECKWKSINLMNS